MATIIQTPDSLSFSNNLKKFRISSSLTIPISLNMGQDTIFDQTYAPGEGDIIEIDLRKIVDKLLVVGVPTNDDVLTQQPAGLADFTLTIDGTAHTFTAVKGGVNELQSQAHDFMEGHFLSWQPQVKRILQYAPEWLGAYAVSAADIKVTAYFSDGSSEITSLCTMTPEMLWSINTSWASVNSVLEKKNPVAWDVVMESSQGEQLSYIQRYQLRNPTAEENLYIWCNTLGGIDSVSLTGYLEDDKKIDHKFSETTDEILDEYWTDRNREIKQSTGFLTTEESRWLEDFFISPIRYRVREDGAIKRIVLTESKVISSSADDMLDHEFTYRYADDPALLNLERTLDPLPAPEGLSDFFLIELLSRLTTALYQDNLYLAVQSPYALGWQKLSFAQLWESALPTLVDNTSIWFYDGKLRTLAGTGGGGGGGTTIINNNNLISKDARSVILDGKILWVEGMSYQSTFFDYLLLGVPLTADPTFLTLNPADPDLPRIDMFYLNQWGKLKFMTGQPAVNPTSPILNAFQLEVMTVYIAAGATQPSGLNVVVVYDEQAPSEFVTSATQDEFVTVEFDSPDAPSHGTKRIKMLIDVPIGELEVPLHHIGEKYQGGKIFWLEDGGRSGLIVSEYDVHASVFWSRLSGYSTYTTEANGVEIGTGKRNSELMLAKPAAAEQAVSFCDDLMVTEWVNGEAIVYDDFYMPSEKELFQIWVNRYLIGGLSTLYWSSTEVTGSYNWKRARCINFNTGTAYTRDKNNAYSVRAIRSFNDEEIQPGVVQTYAPKETVMTFSAAEPLAVNQGLLSMKLNSSMDWLESTSFMIEAYLGATQIGSIRYTPLPVASSYRPGEPGWQLVAIYMKDFNCSRDKFDSLKISPSGSWPNGVDWGLDEIRYQYSTIVLKTDGKLKLGQRLSPLPDNVTTLFSTPTPYMPGTVKVFANGHQQTVKIDYNEVDGKVLFVETPLEGEILTADYYEL